MNVIDNTLIPITQGSETLYIEADTGELRMIHKHKPLMIHDTRGETVGMTTKWLDECVTEDDVIKTVSIIDGLTSLKTKVDNEYIIELLLDNHITQRECKVLRYLIHNIFVWNFTAFRHRNVSVALEISTPATSQVIKSLADKGWIDVIHQNSPYKGDFMVRINPTLAWKGADFFREEAIEKWIKKRSQGFSYHS